MSSDNLNIVFFFPSFYTFIWLLSLVILEAYTSYHLRITPPLQRKSLKATINQNGCFQNRNSIKTKPSYFHTKNSPDSIVVDCGPIAEPKHLETWCQNKIMMSTKLVGNLEWWKNLSFPLLHYSCSLMAESQPLLYRVEKDKFPHCFQVFFFFFSLSIGKETHFSWNQWRRLMLEIQINQNQNKKWARI